MLLLLDYLFDEALMAFPFLAAAAPIISSVVGGLFSKKGGEDRNKAASAQAQRQMDFQERMSSSAHQREVKDLRAAGLNPILSATGGRGASSPGGAQAPVQDVLTPAVNSALSVRRMSQEIKNLKATELQALAATEASSALAKLRVSQDEAIAPAAGAGRLFDSIVGGIPGGTVRLPDLPNVFGSGGLFSDFQSKIAELLRGVQSRGGALRNPVGPRLSLKNLNVSPPSRIPTGGGRNRPGGR